MSESKVRELHPELAPGQLAAEIASRRPLYIFSLDALCIRGERVGGRDGEYDDGLVVAVGDTLMALGFAGAECWVVSDRDVKEAPQTADWMGRNGLRAEQVYLGYTWGSDMGLDAEDMGRLKAVFERKGDEGRWPEMTVYSVGVAERRRVVLA